MSDRVPTGKNLISIEITRQKPTIAARYEIRKTLSRKLSSDSVIRNRSFLIREITVGSNGSFVIFFVFFAMVYLDHIAKILKYNKAFHSFLVICEIILLSAKNYKIDSSGFIPPAASAQSPYKSH